MASHYDGLVRDLVGQLKYGGQQSAARFCADLIVGKLVADQFTLVTAVPAATGRQLQRGYNQAELIARLVAAKLELPYARVLRRNSEARQVGHSRSERLAQAESSYEATRSRLVAGSRILLIDDVLTTGATLAACAGELRGSGARSVWAAVVAKH